MSDSAEMTKSKANQTVSLTRRSSLKTMLGQMDSRTFSISQMMDILALTSRDLHSNNYLKKLKQARVLFLWDVPFLSSLPKVFLDALVIEFPDVYKCTAETDIDKTYEIPNHSLVTVSPEYYQKHRENRLENA